MLIIIIKNKCKLIIIEVIQKVEQLKEVPQKLENSNKKKQFVMIVKIQKDQIHKRNMKIKINKFILILS